MSEKICTKCSESFPHTTEFFCRDRGKLESQCKKCRYKTQAKYRKTSGYKKNKRRNDLKWYQDDPGNRVTKNVRSRCYHGLKDKTESTIELVGLNGQELMDYLETMFEPGMTRENYGTIWHIDHIFPISQAYDDEHRKQLFHYLNTQPMFIEENLSKGSSCLISIEMKTI